MTHSAALSIQDVTKTYSTVRAVDNLTLDISGGSMFGLLGPNGAGKTTLMRMVMNIIKPDSGSIKINGEQFSAATKSLLGYLPEERGMYPAMKLLDHLKFFGELRGLTGQEARKRSMDWLERFGLADRANKKVRELSKGMQQKAQFIGTILHEPQILILDEPFSGLDPVNAKFLTDILLELKQGGRTIILSTHLMEHAEKLCDAICLINGGKIVVSGNTDAVRREYAGNTVRITYSGDASEIAGLSLVESTTDHGDFMDVHLKSNAPVEDLFDSLGALAVRVRKLEPFEMSLNEIFINAVGKGSDV